MRAHENQRGTFPLGLRHSQRAVNRCKIVSILHGLRVPAIRFETQGTIFREGDVSRGGKRDVVVVIKAEQLAKPQMTRERRGLGRDAFHQIAVADQHIRVMIDDLMSRSVVVCGEISFRDGDADAIGESLTERTGRRLDSRRQSALRMSRRLAAPLAKLFDLLQGQIVAREMQQAVKQHRAMSGRQNKPVAIKPMRIGRIMPEKTRP